MMRFQFDGNQEYQLDAVRAVVDLFDGQPPVAAGFSLQAGRSTMLATLQRAG